MPASVGDPNKPWVCPPSLVKVFEKRRARQAMREAKLHANKVAHEQLDAEFYRAVRAAANRERDD